MKIKGVFHVVGTEFEKFNKELNKDINILQDDNQEVEVQYSTNVAINGQIVYSALILGRVKD